ncbi:MAG TPA: class I SAM-dependent methyltransferase [Candidatus Binatia bacterium]|nr:class I SAM-dependent methyltransferase [Candidatus Binatia bacterium]
MMQDRAGQIELAARLVGYRNASRYQTRGEFLFKGIPLDRKHVLEVGCGIGAWAIWATLHGADRVIGLEPEADGSTSQVRNRLQENISKLGLGAKILSTSDRLEELADLEPLFDVVVMFNVINHLDEAAVIVLNQDRGAFEKYVTMLKRVRAQMRAGGWIIVADCARRNFWNQIGFTAPLVPWIEWHKHQNPRVWARVFAASGFRLFDLRWSPLQPFPRLTSNWLAQYLTCSDFVMRLRAS